jgi:hypothetical protein
MSARSPVVAHELQQIPEEEISQVTSVSQLSDVQPTD